MCRDDEARSSPETPSSRWICGTIGPTIAPAMTVSVAAATSTQSERRRCVAVVTSGRFCSEGVRPFRFVTGATPATDTCGCRRKIATDGGCRDADPLARDRSRWLCRHVSTRSVDRSVARSHRSLGRRLQKLDQRLRSLDRRFPVEMTSPHVRESAVDVSGFRRRPRVAARGVRDRSRALSMLPFRPPPLPSHPVPICATSSPP